MHTPTTPSGAARRPGHRPRGSRRPHLDTPDTMEAFQRLALLPDGAERDALRAELVEAWLPMTERIAARFSHRGESHEDLRQVAALGLVKAVDRFDPGRGHAFESYAVPTVTGEIKRHFRDHLWTVHVPRRVQELRNRVRTACQELTGSAGTGGTAGMPLPDVADIAAQAGLSQDDVHTGLQALESYAALSLDAETPGTEHGRPLGDVLGRCDPDLDVVVDLEAIRPRLRALPERERAILYMRFFADMTQRRIAERLGISQMHVSRLIARSCGRLREQVLSDRWV